MTICINLWGGPGVGKSRTAAALFQLLKAHGKKVELITERAKFYTYQNNKTALEDQFLLMAEQEHLQRIAASQCDFIVTDSPPLLGIAYAPVVERNLLFANGMLFRSRYDNRDVFLIRDTSRPYEQYGRTQTEDESVVLHYEVAGILHRTNSQWVRYIAADTSAPARILQELADDLKEFQ